MYLYKSTIIVCLFFLDHHQHITMCISNGGFIAIRYFLLFIIVCRIFKVLFTISATTSKVLPIIYRYRPTVLLMLSNVKLFPFSCLLRTVSKNSSPNMFIRYFILPHLLTKPSLSSSFIVFRTT